MTVENAGQVDFVAQQGDRVRLVISDHLDWSSELEHFWSLQEKLNTYIGFFESGELFERFPDARGKSASVHIAVKYPPTPHAESHLLRPAADALRSVGLNLTWAVHSPG